MNKTLKLIIACVVTLLFISTVTSDELRIDVDENTYFHVDNVEYTFSDEMIFNWIDQCDDYIIFNTTYLYITAPNDLTITMDFMNESLTTTAQGDLLIRFNAHTVAGNVSFNLSGLVSAENYTIKRNGTTISEVTGNATGFITFYNSIWTVDDTITVSVLADVAEEDEEEDITPGGGGIPLPDEYVPEDEDVEEVAVEEFQWPSLELFVLIGLGSVLLLYFVIALKKRKEEE